MAIIYWVCTFHGRLYNATDDAHQHEPWRPCRISAATTSNAMGKPLVRDDDKLSVFAYNMHLYSYSIPNIHGPAQGDTLIPDNH